MPVDQMAAATDATPRTNPRFRPRKIVPPIAGLLAIAAFLLLGPIGLGNGPLGVPSIDGRFGFTTTHPTAYVATLVNAGGSTAVIDSVTAAPADGYAPARVLSVRVAGRSSYGCVYTAMSSLSHCARPPFAAAAGFAVGPHANTVPGNRGGPALVIEIAAPPAAACVALTAIVVHYHVGIRHYTATDPQGFVWACGLHAPQPPS
jgi:hypothetical protein